MSGAGRGLTGKTEWYTPPHIIAIARRVVGGYFTFDPASCATANRFVEADKYLTAADDALVTPWRLNAFDRVWMNPPYARGVIGQFVDCWLAEIGNASGCVLVNTDPSAAWYKKLLDRCQYFVLFNRRVAFLDDVTGEPVRGNPTTQTMFLFNPADPFAAKELGTVCKPMY